MKISFFRRSVPASGHSFPVCAAAIVLIASLVFGGCASGTGSAKAQSGDGYSSSGPLAALPPNEGVYYELFVRSFADSDGDGIGDFKGLTAKLDYLNDGNDRTMSDLGVTGLWLMPVFPSQSYHGYNVDDYYGINKEYGSLADFKAFLAAAKKRGISVILDLPLNHSSTYTDWFIASRDPASPFRSWYRWVDEGDARYNLNQKIWGHNVWNKSKGSYYAGLFESGMPDFNLSNPEVRAEFKKVMKYWMDMGVSGFRFDAAGHVYNPAKLAQGERAQEQGVAFWQEMVGYVHSVRSDAYTVGEVWEPTSTRAIFMKGLVSTFHFDLGTRIVDAIREGDGGENNIPNSLYADYRSYAESNPDYIDAPFLTNHDQNRIAGMLKGDPAKLKLAAAIYILAEGVPFIYYGEEIGLMGAKPDEQIRTPMLWSPGTKDRLQTRWVESKYNRNTLPVSVQTKNPDSLLSFYRRLVRAKTAIPALYSGRLTPVPVDSADGSGHCSPVISWLMKDESASGAGAAGSAFVMHNLSASPVTVRLPKECVAADGATMKLTFATYAGTNLSGDGTIVIPALGSAVLSFAK